VLIADCNSSMFIDRPIVIYLGMGQDWNVKVVGKPYIDPLEEKNKAVVKLQIVLQQGVERFYFANISKEGKDARPCMTFDYICNEPREKFTQICREVIREPWVDGFDSNMIEKVGVETDPEDGFHGNFSKTGFNNYIRCPRMFMFGKSGLVDPTNDKMEFGTLLHEFAEFYVCYPSMVDPDNLEAYVGGFIDEYSGLSNEVMQPIDRDQIELGMRNIIRFIDSLELGEVPLDRELDQRHTNRFMERAGVYKCSSLCETEHINDGLGLYGKFDLYVNHTIYDYKTGKISEASSLAENMDVNEVKKYAEFQPILYLAIANVEDPQTRSFVQFYPLAYDWEVSQTRDISGNFRRFVLSDESLGDLMRDDPFIISKITGARSDQLEQCFKDNPEILVDTVADYYSNPIKDWSNDDELVQAIRAAFLGIKSDLIAQYWKKA